MDIAAFYDADEDRRTSDEITYGEVWRTPRDGGATYRANYVLDTREFYVVREPQHGGLLAKYLEEMHLRVDETAELVVEILGSFEQGELQRRLTGWEDELDRDDSLDWLRRRLQRD